MSSLCTVSAIWRASVPGAMRRSAPMTSAAANSIPDGGRLLHVDCYVMWSEACDADSQRDF